MFTEEGYEAVTMRAIASSRGTTRYSTGSVRSIVIASIEPRAGARGRWQTGQCGLGGGINGAIRTRNAYLKQQPSPCSPSGKFNSLGE